MTQEPNEQNNQTPMEPQPEKLVIDTSTNFQLHAAYLAYSDVFDQASDEAKRELNQNLLDLQESKISYETFYMNISRFRHLDQPTERRGRFTVATQRKKDWRMKTQRQERIRRHKK